MLHLRVFDLSAMRFIVFVSKGESSEDDEHGLFACFFEREELEEYLVMI